LSGNHTKIRVLIIGMAYHARMLAEQLQRYAPEELMVKYSEQVQTVLLNQFDVLHIISAPLSQLFRFRSAKIPIVYHWIGSDVQRMVKDTPLRRRLKKWLIDFTPAFHLTVYEPLRMELSRVGVDARLFPLVPAEFPTEPLPLPEKFAVLSYLPAQRWDFYHGAQILEIARRMPRINFHIVATPPMENPPPNIRFHGYVEEMKPLYQQCKVLLRLTNHDGLSKMVLEALGYGRYVLWNHPFPHCRLVETVEDVQKELLALSTQEDINREGLAFVTQHYHPRMVAKQYVEFYRTITGSANG